MARTSTTEAINRTVTSSTTRGKRGSLVMDAATPWCCRVIRGAGPSRHVNGPIRERETCEGETLEVGRWFLLTDEPPVLTYGDVGYVSVSWRFCRCRCRSLFAPLPRFP